MGDLLISIIRACNGGNLLSTIKTFFRFMSGENPYDELVKWESERRFWDVAKYQIPGLIPQRKIRPYIADFSVWADKMPLGLIIEIQGKKYHGGDMSEEIAENWYKIVDDWERAREILIKAGWVVVFFPAADCFSRPQYMVNQVKQMIKSMEKKRRIPK